MVRRSQIESVRRILTITSIAGSILIILLLIFVLYNDRPSTRQKSKLKELMGIEQASRYNMECEIFNPNQTKTVIFIHGHGDSRADMFKLARKTAEIKTEYTAVACNNIGFTKDSDAESITAATQQLYKGSTYHAALYLAYSEVINGFNQDNVTVVGFSMGSHQAMYLGALNPRVGRTIAIAGLIDYRELGSHAVTQIIPQIYKYFTMTDISCMNKDITWLYGSNDTLFPVNADVPPPCSNFKMLQYQGGHELPKDVVLDLL